MNPCERRDGLHLFRLKAWSELAGGGAQPRTQRSDTPGSVAARPAPCKGARSAASAPTRTRSALASLALVTFFTLLLCAGWSQPDAKPQVSFEAIDILIDSQEPLAAYQVELKDTNGVAKIVGIEGGEGVYATPPYYDARAMQHEHVIIGALSTAPNLPTGLTRVARIHVELEGKPNWTAALMTAGSVNAQKIDATVKVQSAEGARK